MRTRPGSAPSDRTSRWGRRLAGILSTVALVGTVAGPPAHAEAAIAARPSWGTAPASTRAQMVRAIVEVGGTAYLGGAFTGMVKPGGGSASRARLAAVDAVSGNLTPWDPHADGTVWAMALAADGASVYVGGDFSHIAGRSVSKLAKISIASGAVDPDFHPVVKGRVRGLALDGARLYVAGNFTSIGGQARPKLAAVDAASGAVLGWTPPPLGAGRYVGHTGIPTPEESSGNVYSVAVIGSQVFAAGTFLNLGGEGGLVSLDGTTGALAGPQYRPGRPVFSLATTGGTLFAAAGGAGGRAYAFTPGVQTPKWSVKLDGDAVGIGASASTVYVMGHYDYIVNKTSSCYQSCPDGTRRHHLAAFNASDGALAAWNPDADTSTGPYTVTAGAANLYIGGEFTRINWKAQPGFAIFPGAP